MNFRNGLVLALGASLILGGCAAGATGGATASGPTASPTGKTYAPGTAPKQSRFSNQAQLLIAQQQYQNALTQAQQGIAADTGNPIHYFLAGQAYAGMGNVAEANRMFERAQQIYPAYELEVEPAREEAWARAFNAGVQAYQSNNLAQAAEAWSNASAIYNLRPESFQNLAAVYEQQQQYDKAIEAYRAGIAAARRTPAARQLTAEEQTERTEALGTMTGRLAELLNFTEQYGEAERLFREQLATDANNVQLQSQLALALSKQNKTAEAQEIYNRLLSNPSLSPSETFNVGVALFNAKDYPRAGQAFQRVTQSNPNSRDAWYNYANALYAGEQFEQLIPVATRLNELDPLNQNAALILAQAYSKTKQNQRAVQALQRIENAPILLGDLQLRPGQGKNTITGQVTGNKANAGQPVQVRFTFYNEGQTIGTQTVTVTAPAKEATANFEVTLESPTTATAYSYEVVS